MLTGYFDESGIHKGDHLCVVAGFVGDEGQWTAVANEWIKALGPRRKNLHMGRLRWTKTDQKLLSVLGPIPERYNLRRIVGGLWLKDYEEVVKGRVGEPFTTPYLTAAQVCMVETLAGASASDRVQFVFDRQHIYENIVQKLFEVVFKLSKDDPRVLESPYFMAHERTVCLDPADYLAFQVREYNTYKDSKKAAWGMSILGNGEADGYIYSRVQLEKLVNHLIAHGVVPGDKPPIIPSMRLFDKRIPGRINLLQPVLRSS